MEYICCGQTIKSLTKLTDDYKKTYFVRKYKNDGSKEIFKLIKAFNLPKSLKICGVNTDYCVYETVCGLKNYTKNKIQIIGNACNTEEGLLYSTRVLKIFDRFTNLEVI